MSTRKHILVFGATGEIGGRIARQCVDAGHAVTGVTRGVNTQPHPDMAGVESVVKSYGLLKAHTNYFNRTDIANFIIMKVHN